MDNLDSVVRAHDKGVAIQPFLFEAPFTGSIPVLPGDDLTDADGLRTITNYKTERRALE